MGTHAIVSHIRSRTRVGNLFNTFVREYRDTVMKKLSIQTSIKKQIIDITEAVSEILSPGKGVCHVFVQHTTAAISTADLDPGTDLDMLDAFEAIMPKMQYRHPHNPSHVTDHIISTLLGSSVCIPFQNGTLLLGTWQRIILAEFDGPRTRTIVVSTTQTH